MDNKENCENCMNCVKENLRRWEDVKFEFKGFQIEIFKSSSNWQYRVKRGTYYRCGNGRAPSDSLISAISLINDNIMELEQALKMLDK